MTVPWFGPNAWEATLQPVPGGNLPATQAAIGLKLTFKEGGAPDFHSNLERIKERLQQVVSTARENNLTGSRPGSLLENVDLNTVHLDQLPSYQESGQDRIAPQVSVDTNDVVRSPAAASPSPNVRGDRPAARNARPRHPGPPGYEETLQQSVQAEFNRRLSQGQD